MAVTAAGFLRRQQFFVGVERRSSCGRRRSAYVRAIVYAGGQFGLIRWTGGFRVKPWPGTEDKIAVVIAEASRVSGLPITMTTSGPADVEFVLDPAEPALADFTALAVTFRTYSGLTITRSRVVFRSLGEFLGTTRQHGGRTNTALHEMGHVLGLGHSISYHDVMSNENDRNPGLTYGAGEELALRMMYAYRAGGNALPDRALGRADRDRAAHASLRCRRLTFFREDSRETSAAPVLPARRRGRGREAQAGEDAAAAVHGRRGHASPTCRRRWPSGASPRASSSCSTSSASRPTRTG